MQFGRTSYLPNPNPSCILQNPTSLADFACNDTYLRLLWQARKEGEGRCSYRTSESFFSMSETWRGSCARGDRECPGEMGSVSGRWGMSRKDGECPGEVGAVRPHRSQAEVRVPQLPWQDNGSIGRWLGDKGAAFRDDFICIQCDLCLKWLFGKCPRPEALLSNAELSGLA